MAAKNGGKGAGKQANGGLSPDRLEDYMKLMSRYGIAELEVESEEARFALRTKESFSAPVMTAAPAMAAMAAPAPTLSAPPRAAAPAPAAAPAAAKKGKEVRSPFVGTFYRSPAPGKEPYIKVGQSVSSGDVLCIIEAMKLMNEIEAEFGGKVIEVLVEDAQPVEFGEPLFLIDPS
ncbi:MAG TPA: acetyl-CoA carboxylase biotin carboxyl carrier protein [Bdellovibrionota bacterium]|nr:acetyl-CoA carboxylase biotin carboxyl carrier protein [Bdellovibrionota bacterium]